MKKTCGNRSFWVIIIMGLCSFIIKQVLNISQATGLGAPDSECSSSPLIFLRQGAREIKAKEFLPLLPPVP